MVDYLPAPLFIAYSAGISSEGGFLFLSYLIFLRLSYSDGFAAGIFYLWVRTISYQGFASSGRVLGISIAILVHLQKKSKFNF